MPNAFGRSPSAMKWFGRLRSLPDPRDYRLRTLLPKRASKKTFRYWYDGGWWGDQGATPRCVAYSLVHWLEDGPVGQTGPVPTVDPAALYHEAQVADEYPGENYDGTSVRGGAKALQTRGYIESYYWAKSIDEITQALLTIGPIVMGTDWYEGMMAPDAYGRIHRSGVVLGGHAYIVNGCNTKTGFYRIKNSWGRAWGVDGRVWISKADLAALLSAEGEAMLAVEVKKSG